MTSYYRTEAFVFKKEDRLEADRIFLVFTKDFGRIEIFAKSIRNITSKLRGGIEIFSLSEIEFIQGKNRKTLIDTLSIEKFKGICQIPEKFEIANNISNLIDNFIKGQEKDDDIFNLLNETFNKLNNCQPLTAKCQLIYYYFFWNLVFILGYGPELSKCAGCQQKLNPYNLYFSNREGGVICKSCSVKNKEAIEVNSDIVKILRLILKKDWNILSKLKMEISIQKSLKEISYNYCSFLFQIYE